MNTRACLVAVCLIAITAACDTGSATQEPTIVIASDFPTTGAPGNTVPLVHAIQLAIAQHQNIGRFRLKYMPLDDSLGAGASTMLGVQNVKLMVADPRVMGMIGPYNSYVIRDEIPRANAADLVMLSPSSTDGCLTTPPYCNDRLRVLHASRPNNFFRISPPDYKQATAMGRIAVTLGLKRVAVLNEMGDDGNLMVGLFGAAFGIEGGRVVSEGDLEPGTTDFTGFLNAARAAGAQAIYALGDESGGFCEVGVQMRTDFRYLLTWDGATGNDNCFADKVAPTTQIFGSFADNDPTYSHDAAAHEVVKAYANAYPQDKELPAYTFAAYDCAQILIEAISRVVQANGGSAPTRSQVLDAVAHGSFVKGVASITGTYAFDANGDAITPLMSVWTVKDGHWVYLRPVDVSATPR